MAGLGVAVRGKFSPSFATPAAAPPHSPHSPAAPLIQRTRAHRPYSPLPPRPRSSISRTGSFVGHAANVHAMPIPLVTGCVTASARTSRRRHKCACTARWRALTSRREVADSRETARYFALPHSSVVHSSCLGFLIIIGIIAVIRHLFSSCIEKCPG